jgi:hypothetical protein
LKVIAQDVGEYFVVAGNFKCKTLNKIKKSKNEKGKRKQTNLPPTSAKEGPSVIVSSAKVYAKNQF